MSKDFDGAVQAGLHAILVDHSNEVRHQSVPNSVPFNAQVDLERLISSFMRVSKVSFDNKLYFANT